MSKKIDLILSENRAYLDLKENSTRSNKPA